VSHFKLSGLIIGFLFALFGSALIVCAQTQRFPEVKVRIAPEATRVLIEGSAPPRVAWSFSDAYAGAVGLGTRISDFQAFDNQGTAVQVRQKAPGQFESVAPASSFKYSVNLAAPSRSSDAALVSWLNADRGVLVPGDLLPADLVERTNIRIELPPLWNYYASQISFSGPYFPIVDASRFVFVVGKRLRVSTKRLSGGSLLNLIADGDWAFQDSEAINLSEKILKTHSKLAGRTPCEQTTLTVLPLPVAATADRWSALTRGCAVTILLGKQPSRVSALSQLANALTHELFHLWIPNGLTLEGDYDWFYEGFTVYHAARVAVDLDLLTFNDFLTALSRAYDGSFGVPELNQLSLLEASKRRFTTGAAGVYAKAMLVAFIYDLNLRYQTQGKRSLDDVYRGIFRPQKTGDGNAIVMAALSAEFDRQNFVARFVTQPVSIDLQSELAPFGLRVEKFGFRTRIVVNEKLSKRQRDLLRDLGYNDRTR
jgi:hypothetical protein